MVLLSLRLVALSLVMLGGLTNAHPGEVDEVIHPADVGRRQLEAGRRHVQARNCAPQIAAHIAARKAKRALLGNPNMQRRGPDSVPHGVELWRRGLAKRGQHTTSTSTKHTSSSTKHTTSTKHTSTKHLTTLKPPHGPSTSVKPSSTTTARGPTYTSIQNSTCVTAPDVTEGPYFVNNEFVRNDIRETQGGIDLLLDIGVIDTTTCEPLDDAFVEIWSCNATGQYAGFTTLNQALPPFNITQAPPTATGSVSGTVIATSTRRPPPGGPGGPPGGGVSQNMTDQYTFLRGGTVTNKAGVLEFKTIYPGFYTGRTIHIHALVQTNYTIFPNGTIGSKLGDTHHIGQIFFEESLSDQVLATVPYTNTTQRRTLNSQDGILADANTDGYNSFADAKFLGATVEDGVLAYITIGVDTTHHLNISSTNYASSILFSHTSPLPTNTSRFF